VTGPEPLPVTTFNLRQMDGAQSWPFRKDLLVETVRLGRPHLLGTQEIFPEQAALLLDRMPDFGSFGRGRFGDDRDQHNIIFFDRRRFSLVERGELWYSRTPTVPGSSDGRFHGPVW
jgi:hypothetical protein